MITPITTKDLGINSETGLQEILKVWEVNISARTELIRVIYEIVTISPTNLEIKSSGDLEYTRYNHPNNMSFDMWRGSPIGIGISQAIEGTIADYPNLEQSTKPPVES